VLGWFEPGLQAPLAKAFMGLSGLYATKLRYGGHEWGVVSRGICKFPTRPRAEDLATTSAYRVFRRLSGLVCDIDLSIFTE
jgi:hypothetical protein